MQFTLTPFFTLIGLYSYLSPMLLVYGANKKKYDLHNGTSFDYLMVMRGIKKGRPMQNKILEYYLEGLLRIVEDLEKGMLPPEVKISGTSYFFSEATARRLGFEIEKPTAFYTFNQYINYLDLLWMYSLAKGKLTFPNLKNVKAASIKGAQLVENKAYLQQLYQFLQRKKLPVQS